MGANRLKFLMIVFRLKLFSWQPTAIASLLPCLNSSNEWVHQLRKFAIASSPQLKLETLEQQREVMRIAYRMGRGSTSQILAMEDKRDLPFGSTALRAASLCGQAKPGTAWSAKQALRGLALGEALRDRSLRAKYKYAAEVKLVKLVERQLCIEE